MQRAAFKPRDVLAARANATFTIRIDRAADGKAVRAEINCAHCGRVVFPRTGSYALQVTIARDGESIRGTVTGTDPGQNEGRQWSFKSGTELAQLVRRLGHTECDA